MSYKIQGTVEGLPQLLKSLDALDKKVRKKTLRKMITKAGQMVAKKAKQSAPRETGLLRKSIGQKVKVYPKTGVAVAIVGPRSDTKFRQTVTRKKGRWTPFTGISNPVKYAHLVELGTTRAGKKPFLGPAVSGQQAAILDAMAAVAKEALGS